MKNKVRYLFANKVNTLVQTLYLKTIDKVALTIGLATVPIAVNYDKKVVSMYFTCASTDSGTSFEPVLINTIMTGAGQVGGRVRINMESNVRLGSWTNALKVSVDWKTNGSMKGLGSVACFEMTMMASGPPSPGEYPVLELQIAMPSGHVGDNTKSFIYCGVTGDNKANFDSYGYLFRLFGMTSKDTGFWKRGSFTATNGSETLRVRTPSGVRYIVLYDSR